MSLAALVEATKRCRYRQVAPVNSPISRNIQWHEYGCRPDQRGQKEKQYFYALAYLPRLCGNLANMIDYTQ